MYIRTKTRKNKSGNQYIYAYMAKIKRRKNSNPKQKVIRYLGRVYKLVKKEDIGPKIENASIQEMLKIMTKTELKNHGFCESSENILKTNDIEVNLDKKTVINIKKNKKACLMLNQGILCDDTLKNVLEYSPPNESLSQIAKSLARRIVEAGLPADQQSTIKVFKAIQSMINNAQH